MTVSPESRSDRGPLERLLSLFADVRRGEALTVLLLMLNVFLLIVGCLMDIGSAILVLAPMLAPLAVDQGIGALHFGIIMVVNLEIGYLTPPLGLNLIVAMSVFRWIMKPSLRLRVHRIVPL